MMSAPSWSRVVLALGLLVSKKWAVEASLMPDLEEGQTMTLPFRAAASTSNNDDFADGIGTNAVLNGPGHSVLSSDDALMYVADQYNNRLRQIDMATLEVTTVAGEGVQGNLDGIGTNAQFIYLGSMALMSDDTTIIASDPYNYNIRVINVDTKAVTTLAGSNAKTQGFANGVGTNALFRTVGHITLTSDDATVYVIDATNYVVRKIDVATQEVTTVAGYATSSQVYYGYSNGVGDAARFNRPEGAVLTSDDSTLYVLDRDNYRVRRIVLATRTVTTFAGTGSSTGCDDGAGLTTPFCSISSGIALSPDDKTIYLIDWGAKKIKMIDTDTQMVTTLAGSGVAGSVDGTGTNAEINFSTLAMSRDGAGLHAFASTGATLRIVGTGFVTPVPAPSVPPAPAPTAKPTPAPTEDTGTGTCVHADNTVTRRLDDGTRVSTFVKDVKKGDKLLAVDNKHREHFAVVKYMPHSKSTEDFVSIVMVGLKYHILVTLHHMIYKCRSDEDPVEAMDVKAGECLRTVSGHGTVESAERVEAKDGDVTYTIELEDADVVAVGGIFMHAKMPQHVIQKAPAAAGAAGVGNNHQRATAKHLQKLMEARGKKESAAIRSVLA